MTDKEVFERDLAIEQTAMNRRIKSIVKMVLDGKGDSIGCRDDRAGLEYIASQYAGLEGWINANLYDED